MTWVVEVDVALRRPPRADATVYVALSEADFGRVDAEVAALQIAQSHRLVVMAVGCRVSRSDSDLL